MEKLRKQTVNRIAEFFNGESANPKVDTYKKLLDFENEINKAINFTDSSSQFNAYFKKL